LSYFVACRPFRLLPAVVSSSFLFFFFQCPGHPRALHSFPTRRSSDLPAPQWPPPHWCSPPAHPLAEAMTTMHRTTQPSTSAGTRDRKSTRLNSSHVSISYAVFCLKKKTETNKNHTHITKKEQITRRHE